MTELEIISREIVRFSCNQAAVSLQHVVEGEPTAETADGMSVSQWLDWRAGDRSLPSRTCYLVMLVIDASESIAAGYREQTASQSVSKVSK